MHARLLLHDFSLNSVSQVWQRLRNHTDWRRPSMFDEGQPLPEIEVDGKDLLEKENTKTPFQLAIRVFNLSDLN